MVTLLLNVMLTKQNFSLLPASTQPSLLKLMLISKANGLMGFQRKC